MDELIVKTDKKKRLKSDITIIGVIFVIISAVAAFVILRNSGWQTFLLTELMVVLALGWAVFRTVKSGNMTLHFKGDTLCITYSDGRKYNVSDVDRSYFRLEQSKKEQEQDMGALYIDSTNFRALHIVGFSSVKQYIATHFNGEKKSIYYFDDDEDEE